MQKYWADNQISCTVSFDNKKEGHDIKSALNYFQYQLKGISFLPIDDKAYKQMPYEEINEEEYKRLMSNINKNPKIKGKNKLSYISHGSNYCDNDTCNL